MKEKSDRLSVNSSVSSSNRASEQKATVHSLCFTHSVIVPGAGIEPAQPQWPQDFKYYATLQNATKRDILEQKEA